MGVADFSPRFQMVHSTADVRIRLDYGTDGLEVDLPDERVTVIEPMARPAVSDPRATLLKAIRSPYERAPLRETVRAGQKVAISVCDITRAQPRIEQLQAIFEELPQVKPETSRFSLRRALIVATPIKSSSACSAARS